MLQMKTLRTNLPFVILAVLMVAAGCSTMSRTEKQKIVRRYQEETGSSGAAETAARNDK